MAESLPKCPMAEKTHGHFGGKPIGQWPKRPLDEIFRLATSPNIGPKISEIFSLIVAIPPNPCPCVVFNNRFGLPSMWKQYRTSRMDNARKEFEKIPPSFYRRNSAFSSSFSHFFLSSPLSMGTCFRILKHILQRSSV